MTVKLTVLFEESKHIKNGCHMLNNEYLILK